MRLEISVCFFSFYILESDIPGGDTGGATPLPIPNRDVKPSRADGTVLVTAWESRSLPGFFFWSFCDASRFRSAVNRRREELIRQNGTERRAGFAARVFFC